MRNRTDYILWKYESWKLKSRFSDVKEKNSPLELPSFGNKNFQPDGSAGQVKQIEDSISHIRQIISHKPVKLLDSLSQAAWCLELQLAEVTHQTGSHWGHMGHQIGPKLYIYPEEALFLLEAGRLEILYNNLSLSVQRAYSLLLNSQSKTTIEQYRVYSYLSNLGYKVVRHSPQNSVTKYEKSIEVHKLNIKLKQCSSSSQMEKRVQNFDCCMKAKKIFKTEEKKLFPISHEEECDVKEILKKAQVLQSCDDKVETLLNFDFDVYTESFKKSCLQLPNYRVVIHRSEDPVPDLKEIRSLGHKYDDGVPVIQAVVFPDYIAFCEINAANIPDVLE